MTISKALKSITRIQGEINRIKERMNDSVFTLDSNEYNNDFNKLESELIDKIRNIRELKVKIMQANINGNQYTKIVELGEKRKLLDFYKNLVIKNGICEDTSRFMSSDKLNYKSQITVIDKQMREEEIQKYIENIIDELDTFNAITEV